MKKVLFLSFTTAVIVSSATFISPNVYAQASSPQKLIAAQSEISFISRQMGVPVSGNFKKFNADIVFDPKKPEAAKISFRVDLLSADLGNPETEKELKKPSWFDSLNVPAATFVSTSVKALGGGKFEFAGKLAIKGVSQNIVVPIALTQTKDGTNAVGSFNLKRIDFKIGDGDWNDVSLVANEVIVSLKLLLSGVAAL